MAAVLAGDQRSAIRSRDPGYGGKARVACQRTKKQIPPRYAGMEISRGPNLPLLNQTIVLGPFGWMLGMIGVKAGVASWYRDLDRTSRHQGIASFPRCHLSFKAFRSEKRRPMQPMAAPQPTHLRDFERALAGSSSPCGSGVLCDTPFQRWLMLSRFPTLSPSPHWL